MWHVNSCHSIEPVCTYKSQCAHSYLHRTPYFSSLAKCLIHKIIILRRRGATYLPVCLCVITTVYPRRVFALKHKYGIVKRVTASHGLQYNALRFHTIFFIQFVFRFVKV